MGGYLGSSKNMVRTILYKYSNKHVWRHFIIVSAMFLFSFVQALELKSKFENFDKQLHYNIGTGINTLDATHEDQFYLFDDKDYDGYSDKMDYDIDGDGIHNLVDRYPNDPKSSGKDIDKDGIADFVDLDHSLNIPKTQRKQAGKIQEDLYKKYGVTIIADSAINLERIFIIQNLLELEITKNYDMLSIIIIKEINSNNSNYRGKYNKFWKQINLYANQLKNIEQFRFTLTHEFFHFIENQDREFFKTFKNSVGWKDNGYQNNNSPLFPLTRVSLNENFRGIENGLIEYPNFPSHYSTISASEMFAEVGCALLLEGLKDQANYQKRFQKHQSFVHSKAYQLMHNYLY